MAPDPPTSEETYLERLRNIPATELKQCSDKLVNKVRQMHNGGILGPDRIRDGRIRGIEFYKGPKERLDIIEEELNGANWVWLWLIQSKSETMLEAFISQPKGFVMGLVRPAESQLGENGAGGSKREENTAVKKEPDETDQERG